MSKLCRGELEHYLYAAKKKQAQERAKHARQSNKRKKPAEVTANEADAAKNLSEVERDLFEKIKALL